MSHSTKEISEFTGINGKCNYICTVKKIIETFTSSFTTYQMHLHLHAGVLICELK